MTAWRRARDGIAAATRLAPAPDGGTVAWRVIPPGPWQLGCAA
jgi:hypothetical protein